ncbi:MAG: radical SAM/SPASM domain-containing protein [Candidatus Xenobiia bacterium LiM19]
MKKFIFKPAAAIDKIDSLFQGSFPGFYDLMLRARMLQEDRAARLLIADQISRITDIVPFPDFSSIEIETINRCNSTCSFCPVNSRDDTRPYAVMDDALVASLLEQLGAMKYRGALALYSNNEPLLDKRITALHQKARKMVPEASIHLYTNGTLLSPELFQALAPHLDELVIDNYDDSLRLLPTVEALIPLIEASPGLLGKVRIYIRRKNAVRRTRGGEAKNRKHIHSVLSSSCVLPFSQMVIRPDGKVSLCCQDALGKMTLGDCSKDNLTTIWQGEPFRNIRREIQKGRSAIEMCSQCDHFGY